MQLMPASLEKRRISRLLDKRVLECIGHRRRRPVAEDQSRSYQLGERVLKRDALNRRYLLQKVKGKLAADRCADLRDLLDRSQAIEPRHQGVLQGRGNRERRKHGGQHVGPVVCAQHPGLQHGLCQFLHKKWYAVGVGDDLLENLSRQRLAAGDPIDHGKGVAPTEPAQRQRLDVRLTTPGRHEFRPKRDDEECSQFWHPIDKTIEQFERRRVGPVCVFQ